MPDCRFFVESKADIKFIKDYVAEHFDVTLTDAFFYSLNSWSGYKASGGIIAAIKENFDEGKETILILDADNNSVERRDEVILDFQNANIPIHLFLSPNNSNNGNLETTLTNIAVDRVPINCFMSFEDCVRAYNLPLEKSRIYAYLDAVLPPELKIHKKNDLRVEENRDYRNLAHWNLQHEFLQPLHDFLAPFFI